MTVHCLVNTKQTDKYIRASQVPYCFLKGILGGQKAELEGIV